MTFTEKEPEDRVINIPLTEFPDSDEDVEDGRIVKVPRGLPNLLLHPNNPKVSIYVQTHPIPNSFVEDDEKRRMTVESDSENNSDETTTSDESVNKEQPGCLKRYKGILYSVCASIALSLSALIVKYLKEYDKSSMGVYRFQGIMIPSLLILIFSHFQENKPIFQGILPLKEKSNLKTFFLLLVRSLIGGTSLLLYFFSLKHLDVADALVITGSTPVFVTLAACLILGEPCGIFPILNALITLCGVVFIMRPPFLHQSDVFDRNIMVGGLLALGSAFFATLSIVAVRHLKELHSALITLVFGAWGSFQCLLVALLLTGQFNVPDNPRDIGLILAMASLSFVGQMCVTTALKYEQAGPVSLVRTSQVIFAFIWQYLFLHVEPSIYSLIGASIVILAVILTVLRKWVHALPVNDRNRIRFRFILM